MLGSDGITVPSGPTMLPSGIIPPIIPYCKNKIQDVISVKTNVSINQSD
jgi:hypothetical protein